MGLIVSGTTFSVSINTDMGYLPRQFLVATVSPRPLGRGDGTFYTQTLERMNQEFSIDVSNS